MPTDAVVIGSFILNLVCAVWIMYFVANWDKFREKAKALKEKRMLKKMCAGDDYIEYVNKITGVK